MLRSFRHNDKLKNFRSIINTKEKREENKRWRMERVYITTKGIDETAQTV